MIIFLIFLTLALVLFGVCVIGYAIVVSAGVLGGILVYLFWPCFFILLGVIIFKAYGKWKEYKKDE